MWLNKLNSNYLFLSFLAALNSPQNRLNLHWLQWEHRNLTYMWMPTLWKLKFRLLNLKLGYHSWYEIQLPGKWQVGIPQGVFLGFQVPRDVPGVSQRSHVYLPGINVLDTPGNPKWHGYVCLGNRTEPPNPCLLVSWLTRCSSFLTIWTHC